MNQNKQEKEKKQMSQSSRTSIRITVWALAGAYLIYLAYQIIKESAEEGELAWYIILIAIFFIIAGVYLLLQAVRLSKKKKEAEAKEQQEAQEHIGDAAAAWDAAVAEAQAKESAGMVPAQAASEADDSLRAVILAAGKGTRMKSDLPKVLHEIDEKPMALYVKEAVKEAGAEKVCYVVGYQRERVRLALADPDVTFAVQEEQLGTGHAVRCAKDFIGTAGDVFVLCGDTPLITGKTLSDLLAHHKVQGNAVTALSAKLDDPFGYGRIIRDENGAFIKSVEEKDATPEERAVQESNVGMYVFRAADLSGAVDLLTCDNAQGEYYLPDTLMILKEQGKKVDAYCIENTPEILGVNTPEQLAAAAEVIHARSAS